MIFAVVAIEDVVESITVECCGLSLWFQVKEVGVLHQDQRQHIMVSNSHIHWDPELRDVKLIQSMLLVNEIHQIMKQASSQLYKSSTSIDSN
jgi:mRNA deadenylase 3'-5' endonuclease subunit Ccr4